MKNIHKNFTGVKALQAVDFSLREGEIHALMGENGAGKSTLIKVLTGVYEKDEGEIFLKGNDKAVAIHSPQDAQNLGISTVYQEITLCPNLSVAENMFIGRTKGRMQNWKKMNADADRILQSLDIPAKATQQLANCSIAIQQMVAIARAVDMDCKVLILDEPTSSLDDKEVQKLFGLMKDLRARGVGIIFVTHFLDQVYEVCDRITVLRDGKLVGEYEIEKLPRVQLVAKMLGKELDDEAQIKDETQVYHADENVPPVFEVEQLQSNAGIKPFDFYIRKGEVNGFTGLLGSGRSECVRAIFGADRIIGGKIKKNGKEIKIANFTLKISIPINKISHMTPIILNCALKYPLNTFLKLSASIRHLSCIIFGVCFRPNSRIRFLSAMKKYDDNNVKMVEINAFGKFFAIFPA